MKFCLIYNKKSAGGRKSKFIKKILEEISNHHKVDLFETSSESEASEVIKNFEINNYDRLLVAGGDGSVSFAINELIKNNFKLPENFAIGYIPAGTANILQAELGMTKNVKHIANTLTSDNYDKTCLVKINDKHFISCDEFNLENLLNSRIYNNMLELSRSCISQKFRNKNVLQLMWKEIHHYINKNNIDALFGTASFLSTNVSKIEDQLIYLNHHHKMPDNITVSALPKYRVNIDYQKKINLNIRLFAKLPTLIKAYLKFNASIGTGAVIDNKFKTTDVFIFLPIEKINKEYVNKILD